MSPLVEVFAYWDDLNHPYIEVEDTAIDVSQRDRRPVQFPLDAQQGSEEFDGRLVKPY